LHDGSAKGGTLYYVIVPDLLFCGEFFARLSLLPAVLRSYAVCRPVDEQWSGYRQIMCDRLMAAAGRPQACYLLPVASGCSANGIKTFPVFALIILSALIT
jgi:hypothetical protein